MVLWYTTSGSFKKVRTKCRAAFNRKPPSRPTIIKWVTRFAQDGNMTNKAPNRVETSPKRREQQAVLDAFDAQPHLSIRRAARQLNLSRGFEWRVLRRRLYPFKAQLLHELKPEDYARRVQFCKDELAWIRANPSHLQFLVFTDESVFHLDGRVNKQNCRLWSVTNPHWSTEHAVQSPKVVVWCGIWREGVVGPFFFDSTVTGGTYLKMLEEQILPELETAHMQREVCIFQQDGAPPTMRAT